MKTKRRLMIAAVVAMLFAATIPAASYSDILNDARMNSTQLENSRINYENTMLGLDGRKEEKKPVWTVNGTVNPYVESVARKDMGPDASASVKPGLPVPHSYETIAGLKVPVLNATVTLPDDGNTSISIDAPFSVGYSDAYFSIDPAVNVSHTFDFTNHVDSALEDLQDARKHLGAEMSLQKSDIAFENTLIGYFRQFITLEKNIRLSEKTLKDRNTSIDNMLKLKTAGPESLSYRKAVLDRDKAQRDLDNLYSQKELLMRQYKAVTGLDWDGISDIPEADLSLVIHENGNSTVLTSSLDSQIAYENLSNAENMEDPHNLKLGGGISMNLNTLDSTSDSYRASLNTTYRIGNGMSFSANLAVPFEHDFKPQVPTFSISGSWTSSPGSMKGTTRASDEDLKKLENNAVVAENNYRDALMDYENEGLSLQNEISNYLFNLQKTHDDTEYYRNVLELEEISFEKGLNSQKDVDKARFDYEMRQYDEALVKLEGLTLQNKIRTYSI